MANLPERTPFPFQRVLFVIIMWISVFCGTYIYRNELIEQLLLLFTKVENFKIPSTDTLIVYLLFISIIAFCIQQTFVLINEYIENKYYICFKRND